LAGARFAFGLAVSGRSMTATLVDKGIYTQAVLPGATRTEIWARAGTDIDSFPPEMVMGADDLVDAALVGFDRRERGRPTAR
jgi:short-subunit dehydrogenase